MSKYKKVGGGSYGIYKKEKEESYAWLWVIGFIVFLVIIAS